MAIRPFLAMTAAEMGSCTDFPPKIAWMACHFSPYGCGLSNLPRQLPGDSLLVLDDITPIRGHEPEVITRQLLDLADRFGPAGILLDFQQPGSRETAELVNYLEASLPCPMAVSEAYAQESRLPVFASPVPPATPLADHLSAWQGREIWLDISRWGEALILTEDGCQSVPLPPWELPGEGFAEETLHCHYHIFVKETAARFTLWRTEEDLESLLEETETLGVTRAVGLFQEWCRLPPHTFL